MTKFSIKDTRLAHAFNRFSARHPNVAIAFRGATRGMTKFDLGFGASMGLSAGCVASIGLTALAAVPWLIAGVAVGIATASAAEGYNAVRAAKQAKAPTP
jgi:hypothetical protein